MTDAISSNLGSNYKVIQRKVDGKKTDVIKKDGKFYIKDAQGNLQELTMTKNGSIFGKAQFTTTKSNQTTVQPETGNPSETNTVTASTTTETDATNAQPVISTKQQQQIDEVSQTKAKSQQLTAESNKPAQGDDGKNVTYDDQGRLKSGTLKDGRTYTRTYNEDGTFDDTIIDSKRTKNNKAIRHYDAQGKWISGTASDGSTYTNEYNEDGSFVAKMSDNSTYNYDKDGNRTGGKLANGTTYENKYNEDGSYVTTYSDGETQNYDKDGNRTGGKLTNGITYENKYNEDGSYVTTYSNGETQNYDKDGNRTGGKLANGTTYENKYNEDGSCVRTYSDGEIQNYDKDGKITDGKLADGTTYTEQYREDGTAVRTFSDGEIANYDRNGIKTDGKLADGTTYTDQYGEDGKLKYEEFTKEDGSMYYYGEDGKSYARKTKNGNLRVNPKQGETFKMTMERLGITDEADQKAFIEANPKAYKRGYFLLADEGKEGGDVYIPKYIADKLDIQNTLVDDTSEMEKHKAALKAKHK